MSAHAKIIHNGLFVEPETAVIPITTPALMGALGVYETVLTRQGKLIALDEHLLRLQESAAAAGLIIAASSDTIRRWCFLAVAANHADGLLRIVAVDLGNDEADLFLYQMPFVAPSEEEYALGVPVILYQGERALPAIKSLNTLVPGMARKAAIAAGVHDALLVDNAGNITEGSNCNVFAVIDGVLVAPPIETVLAGTVMDQVLAIAGEIGVEAERRDLPAAEIDDWDEAFITSTRRGILPVCRIGDLDIGKPGPITRELMAAYRDWEAEQ